MSSGKTKRAHLEEERLHISIDDTSIREATGQHLKSAHCNFPQGLANRTGVERPTNPLRGPWRYPQWFKVQPYLIHPCVCEACHHPSIITPEHDVFLVINAFPTPCARPYSPTDLPSFILMLLIHQSACLTNVNIHRLSNTPWQLNSRSNRLVSPLSTRWP